MTKKYVGWTLLALLWYAGLAHLHDLFLAPDVLPGGMGNGLMFADFLRDRVGALTCVIGLIVILLGISLLVYVAMIARLPPGEVSTRRQRIFQIVAKWGLCIILAGAGFFTFATFLAWLPWKIPTFFSRTGIWIAEVSYAFTTAVFVAGIYVLLRD